jgi:hypothetical protein
MLLFYPSHMVLVVQGKGVCKERKERREKGVSDRKEIAVVGELGWGTISSDFVSLWTL